MTAVSLSVDTRSDPGLSDDAWIPWGGGTLLCMEPVAAKMDQVGLQHPQCNIADVPKIGASMERGVMLP